MNDPASPHIHGSNPPRKPGVAFWIAAAVGASGIGWLIWHSLADAHHPVHRSEPPPWWPVGVLPFVVILSAIAFLPLIPATRHWWESNLHRFYVALGCAAATVAFALFSLGWHEVITLLEHAVVSEYLPFIVLLFSLYVVSGGIRLSGDLPARPWVNTIFLATGGVLASIIGTTGASMLLIRPLLETNAERRHKVHTVVFFIFLVSNIGGTLLPIGDPPLFLGYLKGVEFFWTLNLAGPWFLTVLLLLVGYFLLDRWLHAREDVAGLQRDALQHRPLRLEGAVNLVWIGGIVLAVAGLVPGRQLPVVGWTVFPFLRELVMLAIVGLSLWTTPRQVRLDNRFNYAAILEVAALFIGIFIAMQIPVMVLQVEGPRFGLSEPWQFFWLTGALSSFLDNAPTYVVFFETANAMPQPPGSDVVALTGGRFIREDLLAGISLGAVFMGAMTYIGNGPNFMVKSIAEQSGVRMPSFFGYMAYSGVILLPTFVLVTLVFLR